MLRQANAIDRTEVDLALNRLLGSQVFERAQRSRSFLQYLVESALAEPPIAVKEYTIAIDVFDRGAEYDPSIDATVRVEASRLRGRLREYYDGEGKDDLWRIEVAKGSYAAVFVRSARVEVAALPEAALPARPAWWGQSVRTDGARVGWVVGMAGLLPCMAVVAAVFVPRHERRAQQAVVRTSTATTSLAIMPVANRSGQPQLDAASDGLTDDLIRQMSQIPALRLIARTTVFSDHGTSSDPRIVGRALGVDAVLTSELRRTPEHLEIVAELSRTKDGTVLLDRQYIVDGNDLRSVQSEIQRDLVTKLDVEASALDPGRKLKSVTSSPEAYQEFLDGIALSRQGTPVELRKAIGHFERAVALDSDFDLAWSALGSQHVLLGLYFEAPRDHMPLAREFVEHALRINPALGEAHGALGLIHLVYDWDLPAADAEMAKAGAEEAAISALACTAHLMERAGHPRTAEAMLTRMLTYNPQSSAIRQELGCVNYYQGNYDAAIHIYRQALVVDPHSVLAYWGLGKTLNAQGKYAEAVTALDTCKRVNGFEPPLLRAETGYAYGASGRRPQAMAIIQELTAKPNGRFVDPYLVAMVFASMNDRERAFEWLQKGVEVRSPFMISLLSDPKWVPYRSDPRFSAVIRSMLNGKAA
jgi:TolB-like protein